MWSSGSARTTEEVPLGAGRAVFFGGGCSREAAPRTSACDGGVGGGDIAGSPVAMPGGSVGRRATVVPALTLAAIAAEPLLAFVLAVFVSSTGEGGLPLKATAIPAVTNAAAMAPIHAPVSRLSRAGTARDSEAPSSSETTGI